MFDFISFILIKTLLVVILSSNIIWGSFFIYKYFRDKAKHKFLLLFTFIPMILLSIFSIVFIIHFGVNTP